MLLHTDKAADPEHNGRGWCCLAHSEVCKPTGLWKSTESPFLKQNSLSGCLGVAKAVRPRGDRSPCVPVL